MIWLILIMPLFHAGESFLDRKGEDKTGKKKDTGWMILIAILLCVAGEYLLHKESLKTLALFLAWRILFFDYLTNWFLKQGENHKHINIWEYTGTSTHWWDQFISKIDWRIRLIARVIIFAVSLWWFVL